MKIKIISLIIILAAGLFCTAQQVATSVKLISTIINDLVDDLVPPAIATDSQGKQAWDIVQNSLSSQLLPLLKGQTVTVGNLQSYLNAIPSLQLTPVEAKLLTQFTNLLLSQIPTQLVSTGIASNPITAESVSAFIEATNHFVVAIQQGLSNPAPIVKAMRAYQVK